MFGLDPSIGSGPFVVLFFYFFSCLMIFTSFFLQKKKKKEECVFVRQDFVIETKKISIFFFAAVLFSYVVRHIFLTEKQNNKLIFVTERILISYRRARNAEFFSSVKIEIHIETLLLYKSIMKLSGLLVLFLFVSVFVFQKLIFFETCILGAERKQTSLFLFLKTRFFETCFWKQLFKTIKPNMFPLFLFQKYIKTG